MAMPRSTNCWSFGGSLRLARALLPIFIAVQDNRLEESFAKNAEGIEQAPMAPPLPFRRARTESRSATR